MFIMTQLGMSGDNWLMESAVTLKNEVRPLPAQVPALWKTADICHYTGFGKNTIGAAINSGELRALRIGPRQTRVTTEDLLAWLHGRGQGAEKDG